MGADQYFECVKSVRLDLLEIFGREYVVEHCISAFKILQEEKVFKIYVTDALKAMGEGKRLADRYADIIIPKKEDTRDPEEIKASIMDKLHRI